jgi:hypothetical protein
MNNEEKNIRITYTDSEVCESLLSDLEALTDEEWDMLAS